MFLQLMTSTSPSTVEASCSISGGISTASPGPEDAFFSAHPDSKLARDHVDQLFLGVFVRPGSSSSGEAISPDFDLRSFYGRSFGRRVLRTDGAPLHLTPVIKWHNDSLPCFPVGSFELNPKRETRNSPFYRQCRTRSVDDRSWPGRAVTYYGGRKKAMQFFIPYAKGSSA